MFLLQLQSIALLSIRPSGPIEGETKGLATELNLFMENLEWIFSSYGTKS